MIWFCVDPDLPWGDHCSVASSRIPAPARVCKLQAAAGGTCGWCSGGLINLWFPTMPLSNCVSRCWWQGSQCQGTSTQSKVAARPDSCFARSVTFFWRSYTLSIVILNSSSQVNPSQTHNNQSWGMSGGDGGAPVLTDDVSLQVSAFEPQCFCILLWCLMWDFRYSWSI